MGKVVDVLLFVWDITLSLMVYPVFYVADMVYLVYVNSKYDINFKEGFLGINKKYSYFIMNGLKIHKERIFGV